VAGLGLFFHKIALALSGAKQGVCFNLPMAGLHIYDQKNAIAVTVIIATAFKIRVSYRKNGLLNRLPTKVSFSIFDF
jgi:hypothetical protein